MKTALLILFAIFLIATAIVIGKLKRRRATRKGAFIKRQIATPKEQPMFWRLTECFPQPEFIVLTQVSFGALLTATKGASRYSFSQKIADFVLTNNGFKVLAIIELDDSSHNGREKEDTNRDAMLTEAGYKVLRYTQTPDAKKLLSDVTNNI